MIFLRRTGWLVLLLLLLEACNRLGGPGAVSPGPAPVATRRDFLIGEAVESPGYGLYSYLLLGSAPTPDTRPRYEQIIAAYLRTIPAQDPSATPSQERWAFNITYAPLNAPAPAALQASGRSDAELAEDVRWVLAHYDYDRAGRLLQRIPGTHMHGPYIVSSKTALGSVNQLGGNYLWQDMSTVSPKLASSWMIAFMKQAAREQYWETPTLERWPLELRGVIASVADDIPPTKEALAEFVSWVSAVN